jgi:GT2 family glycosyltransferase
MNQQHTHTAQTNTNCRTAIVILNWNGQKLLQEFLPQVIENTPAEIGKIIVADNASTDDSIQFIERNYPSVGIIRLEKNYGFAGGYNRAIAQINHEYTVLLNSDATPLASWLQPLVTLMDSDSNIAACVPKIKDYRNPTLFEYAGAAGGMIDCMGYPFCRGRIMNSLEHDNGQYDSSIPVFWASGAALMVRTKQYIECGGLDEEFFAHMEEIDLCWRLKNRGFHIMQQPASEVYHLGGGTLSQQNSRKTYLNFRNNLFMMVKNDYSRFWIPRLLSRMILDGVAALHFIAKREFGFFGAVVKAHIHFHKKAVHYYRKRKNLRPLAKAIHHPEMYPYSIVWHYFIRKKRLFSDLEYYRNIGRK